MRRDPTNGRLWQFLTLTCTLLLVTPARLPAEEWTYTDPSGHNGAVILNDTMTLQCGARMNQWVGENRAPRLLRPSEGPYWSFEVDLTTQGKRDTAAGLLVYRDEKNWIGWGILHGSTLDAGGVLGNRARPSLVSRGVLAQGLRIDRKGNRYEFFLKEGSEWRLAGIYADVEGDLGAAPRVGVFAKSWGRGAPFSTVFRGWRHAGLPLPNLNGVSAWGASSSYPGWGPDRILAGGTWCSAAGTSLPHWLELKLPPHSQVAAIEFDNRVDGAQRHPGIEARQMRIYVQREDDDFRLHPIGEIELAAGRAGQRFLLPSPVSADRIRLEAVSNHGNAEWTEVGPISILGWQDAARP